MVSAGLQAVCIGRAGLDLYANETDTDFADVTGFRKHVGGSPANIALGLATLGVKVGFLGRLSDDMVGRYVNTALQRAGVNTAGVVFDSSGTRTSLALTEMRAEHCGVVLYRNQAADLALCTDDIDAGMIQAASLLLVSGTALSSEPSRSAARYAMAIARASGTCIVLDLDYRAYTWSAFEEACEVCCEAAVLAEVVIGNGEEIGLLQSGFDVSGDAVIRALHDAGVALVCVKDGDAGSSVYPAGGEPVVQAAFRVPVVKPFGAGDAYAAALCAGLLDSTPLALSLRRAAAAAAMVVGSRSCGDATPTLSAIDRFIETYHA